jgi:hypothetical protein
MKTKEQKALAACVELVAAAKEVKRLKSLIGDSLSACHAAFDALMLDGHPLVWESHLGSAYAFETFDPTQYTEGKRVYLDNAEQQAILSACPHCLAAHNAIQERKQARKRLGNARRQITLIGRSS